MEIKRATKQQLHSKIALMGPTGSGKTKTGMIIAQELAHGEPFLVIDTEHRSASVYADQFTFDVIELESYSPQQYIEALNLAEQGGYPVVMVDSLSHAWAGKDGILEFVDLATERSKSKNQFTDGWRQASPLHRSLVERLLSVAERRHLIITMRSKMAYVIQENERGQKIPRKLGLQPIQRDDVEYEFDIIGDMNLENTLVIAKSRCDALNKAVIPMPGPQLGRDILAWLEDGAPPTPRAATSPTSPSTHASTKPELLRAIKMALQQYVPYEGTTAGAYETFMPRAAIEVMKPIFGVARWEDLKSCSLESLQHGYQSLIAQFQPPPPNGNQRQAPGGDPLVEEEDVPITTGVPDTQPSVDGDPGQLRSESGEDASEFPRDRGTTMPEDSEPRWEALERLSKNVGLSAATWQRLRQMSYADAKARVEVMDPVTSDTPPEGV